MPFHPLWPKMRSLLDHDWDYYRCILDLSVIMALGVIPCLVRLIKKYDQVPEDIHVFFSPTNETFHFTQRQSALTLSGQEEILLNHKNQT